MKKTNLTPSPRQKGRCCYWDAFISKGTFLLLIFMLPLVSIAQENIKAKEANYQEYLQSIFGNKADGLEQNAPRKAKNLQMIEAQKKQLIQQAESKNLRAKLENQGINVQKHLDAGYSLEQLVEEINNPKQVTVKGSASEAIYYRTGNGSDLCANATELVCGEEADGSTVGAGSDNYLDCGNIFPSNGEGVWYKITGNNDDNTIAVVSSTFTVQLHAYSSTDGDCNSIQCAGGASGQGSTSVTFFAAGGQTYYINVVGQGTGEGTFTLSRSTNSECNDTPPGDGLSSATAFPIACGDVDSGNTTGFGNIEVGPSCGNSTGSIGVWYKVNVTADYPNGSGVTFNSCGSGFDTEIHVYEGASLNCVDDNDDSCGLQSSVTWDAQPNTDYYIYLSGFSSFSNGTGPYSVSFQCDGITPPPPPQVPTNDTCQTAIELACDGIPVFGNTELATATGNPGFCGVTSGDPTVWYTYSGDAGLITVSLCGEGTDFDTYLSLFTGNDCNALVCEQNVDDSCGAQTEIQFTADGSSVYYIAISGFFGDTGNYQLDVTCDVPPTVPDNDLCENAEVIECGDIKTGNTLLATDTGVVGIFDCGGEFGDGLGAGVWYTATGNGDNFTFDLCGSDYDTKISIFTGSCGSLTCLTANDDGGDCDDGTSFDSLVSFPSVVGETYYVYVSGFTGFGTGTNADRGNYNLELICQPDPCTNASRISCDDVFVFGSNSGANGSTLAPDFCGVSAGSPGVMYEIIGEGTFFNLNTCGSNFDTKLNVYGGSCGSLECITGNDDSSVCEDTDGESDVTFYGALGESYYVWVSGSGDTTGDFQLNISCLEAVDNDLCGDAIALECDSTVTGSTVLSTDLDAPNPDCDGSFSSFVGAGVWYTLEGTGGEVIVSTCNEDSFDTKIVILTGECGSLTCLTGNDDGSGCPNFSSEVQFGTDEGVTYYIYVSGFTGFSGDTDAAITGDFELSVDCLCAPSQDAPECVTVYDGYDPAATATLTGILEYGEAPITYVWSAGTPVDGDPSSVTVTASEGNQNVSVEMTDATGCSATQEFFVYVVDVNCDTRGTDKVEVCHNGTTICVSDDAVAAHLAHGDTLGTCGTELCDEIVPSCDISILSPSDGEIDVNTFATIEWTSPIGITDGYYLTMGTTSGGYDVYDNEDLGNVNSFITEELEYVTTYYYTITPYNSNGAALACMEYSFTTQEDPSPNDDCDGAIALTVNADLDCGVVTSGSTLGATASAQPDDVTGVPNNDVWYSFVATNDEHQISLSNIVNIGGGTSTSVDMGMGIYNADSGCEALVFVDDSDPNSVNVTGLVPGSTYVVRVYGWFSSIQNVEFDICVGTPPPPPANDDCSGAIALTVNPVGSECATTYLADYRSATASGAFFSCDNTGTNTDTWYTFVAPASGEVDLEVTEIISQSGTFEYALFDGCGSTATELLCNDGNALGGLTPGATYTLAIWFDGSGNGTIDICLNEAFVGPMEIVCGTTYNETYCYGNNVIEDWAFASSDGGPLTIQFNAGDLEESSFSGNTFDDLYIYDGVDDTGILLYDSNDGIANTGDLSGQYWTAYSGSLYIYFDSDFSVSCQSSSLIAPWDFDVFCGDPGPPPFDGITVECGTAGYNNVYCYSSNDYIVWEFASSDGSSPLTLEFVSGVLEESSFSGNTFDDLFIYDGLGATATLLYDSNDGVAGTNDLTGLSVTAPSGFMTVVFDADSSVSCQSSSSITPWEFNVTCGTGARNSVPNVVGASNSETLDWSMAPNPTKGKVTLDLSNYLQSDVTIEVMNINGQVIYNNSLRKLQGSKVDVELNNSLPAGMYFVRVAAQGQVSTKKLMIMR